MEYTAAASLIFSLRKVMSCMMSLLPEFLFATSLCANLQLVNDYHLPFRPYCHEIYLIFRSLFWGNPSVRMDFSKSLRIIVHYSQHGEKVNGCLQLTNTVLRIVYLSKCWTFTGFFLAIRLKTKTKIQFDYSHIPLNKK